VLVPAAQHPQSPRWSADGTRIADTATDGDSHTQVFVMNANGSGQHQLLICGRGGNDTIDGKGGLDIVLAAPGNHTIKGGPGNDVLLGAGGNDRIDGGTGIDRCVQGPGRER
jgi:Ca2+-binding RTX toxin-like protein